MATVRYQVDGVPQDGRAQAWFPTPPLSPAGMSSVRRFIHGYPGTKKVATVPPGKPGVTSSCIGYDSNYNASGTLSVSPEYLPPSAVAPDWFAPQLYWNDIAEMPIGPSASGLGVDYMPKPVAATVVPMTPQGVIGIVPGAQDSYDIAMGGRKVGGFRSMHWLRSVVRWPDLSGRYR